MPEEDIAKFVTSIEIALTELSEIRESRQSEVDAAVNVLEGLLAYFKGITPAAGVEEPDVVSFAQQVAEGHAHNLAAYIRKLCVYTDKDPAVVRRCYEYDSTLYQKHLTRYPSLGQLGQRTFGPNNLGIAYLNLLVSDAFVEYLDIRRSVSPDFWEARLQDLDRRFRDTLSFKTAVDFERGRGGLWIREDLSFEAAADNPKGFAGLGRW